MTSSSSIGVAVRDITPTGPVMLAGFGQRVSPSEGVLDPIFAKALWLDAGATRLAFITTDLLCIPGPLAEAVTRAAGERLGLAPAEICLTASHTHSGPAPHDARDGAPGVAAFVAFLQEALVDLVAAAQADSRPALVSVAVGAADLFFNRRTRGRPNRVDPRLPVISVDDPESGVTRAVLFGAGCHPVTLGWDNPLVSADFPGVAQRLIEAALPGAVALFVNTTEGNVIPITSPDRDALDPRGYCGGGVANTRRMGEALAAAVLAAHLRRPPAGELSLRTARQTLTLAPNAGALDPGRVAADLAESHRILAEFLGDELPRALPPGPLWSAASAAVIRLDLDEGEMRRLMIACCRCLGLTARLARPGSPRPVSVPLEVISVNGFDLLTLPGEVLVEVGDAWTEIAGHDQAFVVGLANGHLRYLPLAAHHAEPDAGLRYETVTAGLAPGGVDTALSAASEMLARLRDARSPTR
jgi:hypothetical protein